MSGGILKSRLWTQMLCDIFGREIRASENSQASMLGAACLGMLAAGAIRSVTDFRVDGGPALTPDLSRRQGYMERYARYLEAYERGRCTPLPKN